MKNILVPTDFSDCARVAEEYGLEFAKKTNAEIHFLHLLHTPVDWVKLPLEKEDLYPEVKERIGTAKSELSQLKRDAEKMGIEAQTFLVFDKGQKEVDFHIEHHKHDYIIMGSHGARGVKEVIGSNTQRVIRNSSIPVLVVKDKPKDFNFKDIVFASNFEEDVHQAFTKVVEFAEFTETNIHLLYVNLPFHFKETDEAEAEMETFLKKHPGVDANVNIYSALSEERGILKFTKSIGADFIAITTHGRTGILKMISPSITEGLANHSEFPVLSININTK
ncbi:MAG: universal stress protein [Bacteroidota bacterium]